MPGAIDTSLGRLLRCHRLRANLSLRQVVDGIGVSQGFLSKLESGHAVPKHEVTLLRIAKALRLSAKEQEELIEAAGYSRDRVRLPTDIDARRRKLVHQVAFKISQLPESAIASMEELVFDNEEVCP